MSEQGHIQERTAAERIEHNKKTIAEFREKGGELASSVAPNSYLLLLHTTGAKTGSERISPLRYQPVSDGNYAVFGVNNRALNNPNWYYNLRAHPEVTIEVGRDTLFAKAREAEGEEREAIWRTEIDRWPGLASFEEKASRRLPVVVLETYTKHD